VLSECEKDDGGGGVGFYPRSASSSFPRVPLCPRLAALFLPLSETPQQHIRVYTDLIRNMSQNPEQRGEQAKEETKGMISGERFPFSHPSFCTLTLLLF
jgi:hypothetical protein